jgi:FkbM family methyltransferase
MRHRILKHVPAPLAQLLRESKTQLRRWAYRITPDHRLTPIQRFQRDGFTDLLIRGARLDRSSTVLDVGGHVGLFTDLVLATAPCRIEVFEPMPEFASLLQRKYEGIPQVIVHPYGLAAEDCRRTFYTHGDGTGEFVGGIPVDVAFRGIDQVMGGLPSAFDLVAVNIEGGEYELIPLLVSHGIISRVAMLVVQFHRLDESSVGRREAIRDALRRTHRCAWNYDFVWECWVRNGD